MSYLYSQINRLEEPHNYMYTPFQGVSLLQSYQSSRLAVIHSCADVEYGSVEPDHMFVIYSLPVLEKLFDAVSPEVGKKFRVLLEGGGKKSFGQSQMVDDNLNVLANSLARMTAAESVTTLNLLHALIATQLINVLGNNVKIWLDLLVQRFEVTKKIYEVYQAGLRKGEGANTSVRLYWLFALALSLFYTRTKEIKYLSTLLKVCDLLCSLPEKELRENITEHGLSTILVTEIVSVQRLIEEKGVSFAAE